MELPFVTLDVFTSRPYEGNPLALITIPTHLTNVVTEAQKQAIAREFNLSETVFVHEAGDAQLREWTVDIFTITDELPFAGHPTIGAAYHVLRKLRLLPSRSDVDESEGFRSNVYENANANANGKSRAAQGILITKAGRIPISLASQNSRSQVQALIPHNVHIHSHTLGDQYPPIPGLSTHPDLRDAEMKAPIVSIVKGMTFLLVRLDSLELLSVAEAANPALSFRGVLDKGWREGFVARYYYVLQHGLQNSDLDGSGNGRLSGDRENEETVTIRTRMLEIAMEDPATGSAACALACFLALKGKRGRSFEVVQGVEMGRRSVIGVEVRLEEDGRGIEEVKLCGEAVQIMEGVLRV
ncbi:hypothetical protein B7494_g112 [Chlorociboria aeruginascens]|nr:hypothetical protein B7494_g112 [Chlorociboria aeruginascens]